MLNWIRNPKVYGWASAMSQALDVVAIVLVWISFVLTQDIGAIAVTAVLILDVIVEVVAFVRWQPLDGGKWAGYGSAWFHALNVVAVSVLWLPLGWPALTVAITVTAVLVIDLIAEVVTFVLANP